MGVELEANVGSNYVQEVELRIGDDVMKLGKLVDELNV